jgi:hypothetical protein
VTSLVLNKYSLGISTEQEKVAQRRSSFAGWLSLGHIANRQSVYLPHREGRPGSDGKEVAIIAV